MHILPHEIHIWFNHLATTPEQEDRDIPLLSPDECERARRFHFQVHRQRYIAARALLRKILSTYMALSPQEIKFAYTENEKPFLHLSHHTPLQFNLSHSEEWAVYAFTLNHAIGVDIEKVENKYNEGIPKRFFSAQENSALMQLPVNDRITAFYRVWSRKEAILKATGKGLSLPLSSFSVSIDDVAEVIQLNQNENWTLLPLSIQDGYPSAVATNQLVKKVYYWCFFEQNPVLNRMISI